MQKQMDASWKAWVRLNIDRGCDKEGMVNILLENELDPVLIVAELRYVPQSPALIALMNQKLVLSTPTSVSTTSEQSMYAALDAVVLPFAGRLDSDKAHVYLVDDFLSSEECDELVNKIRAQCHPSAITNPNEPDKYFRTSKTCDLGLQGDALVDCIDKRIADYMGFEVERSESIQGQFYQVGDQFKAHTDYFEPNTDEYEQFAGKMGQRTWTFMLYLNEVEQGGETLFTELGFTVKPRKGMAVVWNSLHPDGSVNPQTAHWAKPVLQGEKFVITKWFRTHGRLANAFSPLPYKQLPIFTDEGFKKMQLPADLCEAVQAFYHERRSRKQLEVSDAIGTFIRSESEHHPTQMIELDDAMRARIFAAICPMLEDWTKCKLKPSVVYGIREYQHGATLAMHVDRIETHQVSAIINVAQAVNEPWPLYIQDHFSRLHKVIMQPGDILFYESARLSHGRPDPLNGEYFANIFAHTIPDFSV